MFFKIITFIDLLFLYRGFLNSTLKLFVLEVKVIFFLAKVFDD